MERQMGFSRSLHSPENLLPPSQCLGAQGAVSPHAALRRDNGASGLALLDNTSSTSCQLVMALLTAVAVAWKFRVQALLIYNMNARKLLPR